MVVVNLIIGTRRSRRLRKKSFAETSLDHPFEIEDTPPTNEDQIKENLVSIEDTPGTNVQGIKLFFSTVLYIP